MSSLAAGSSAPEAVIEADGLVMRFGKKLAVDRASFSVRAGEVYGLLGPNGAGKTTTLRLLLGLLKASAGRARVLGFDPTEQPLDLRARTGYVAQLHSLYADLTVAQNLALYGRLYGLSGKELQRRLQEETERFWLGQSLSRPAGSIPTGISRRVALAAALLHQPQLLILDEPTSGMDARARREFWLFLGGLTNRAVTVIVTTHHLEEVEGCDRLAVMLGGRVRYEGTPAGFKLAYGGPVLEVRARPWQKAFLALKQAFDASLFGTAIAVEPERATRDEVQALLGQGGIAVDSIDERPPTLEDAFLRAARRAAVEH